MDSNYISNIVSRDKGFKILQYINGREGVSLSGWGSIRGEDLVNLTIEFDNTEKSKKEVGLFLEKFFPEQEIHLTKTNWR